VVSEIRSRDWPSLFQRTWGAWSPPSPKRAEEYYIEAFLWWLDRTTGARSSVVRRPDRQIRDSKQPDFECLANGTRFWVEISRLYYPSDRMERLGHLELLSRELSRHLGEQLSGKWRLSLQSHRVNLPRGPVDKIVRQVLPQLVKGAATDSKVIVVEPISLTLERRSDGQDGIIVSYPSGDSYRADKAVATLGDQLERTLHEARKKLASYGLSHGCVLMVTDHRTVASKFVAEAFGGVDSTLYSDLGAVFWLDTSLPHKVEPLDNLGGLPPL